MAYARFVSRSHRFASQFGGNGLTLRDALQNGPLTLAKKSKKDDLFVYKHYMDNSRKVCRFNTCTDKCTNGLTYYY